MSFIPFLTFDGQAEAAMNFYASVFGAGEVQILRFSDAPEGSPMPPSDRVMYSHIMVDQQCLMASDSMVGMEYAPQASVSVNHSVATPQEGQVVFEKLADGGTVTMPFGPVFFSPAFGMVRDRFGTNWMIGVPSDDA